MSTPATTVSASIIKNLQVAETLLLLAVSVLLQFVLHLIPPVNGTPVGMVFLPVFFAPLIALILFRPHVAFIAGVFAPVVNYLLTGAPGPEMLGILTFELVLFVSSAVVLHRSGKTKEFTAVIALLAAKVLSFFIMPLISSSVLSFDFLVKSFIMSVPGLLILFLLNKMLLKYKGE
jgi:hypothetical protein